MAAPLRILGNENNALNNILIDHDPLLVRLPTYTDRAIIGVSKYYAISARPYRGIYTEWLPISTAIDSMRPSSGVKKFLTFKSALDSVRQAIEAEAIVAAVQALSIQRRAPATAPRTPAPRTPAARVPARAARAPQDKDDEEIIDLETPPASPPHPNVIVPPTPVQTPSKPSPSVQSRAIAAPASTDPTAGPSTRMRAAPAAEHSQAKAKEDSLPTDPRATLAVGKKQQRAVIVVQWLLF
ncbi:hypothetical protein FA95DRAFT_1577837 [Auriscalpium vulgare]|uniref:Uncharacterized protein n=1 Tax=Auriscalpium vulgare TaxID=40419 RepID=A0ACB8R5N1_9AGAM|nr:hypothetical protein FA95DRAFT_1577837 [Auriscalpium vulgare]